jgi:quinol monooxygenase YgiN
MEIVVVATFRVKEGREEDARRHFAAVIPPTHEEEGCLRYAFHQAIEDRRTFMMIERWTSKRALDAHLATPHVKRLFTALSDVVEAPAQIAILEPLSDTSGEKGRL